MANNFLIELDSDFNIIAYFTNYSSQTFAIKRTISSIHKIDMFLFEYMTTKDKK